MLPNQYKIAQYILISLYAGVLISYGILPAWNTVHSDFANYYVSAKLISDRVAIDQLYNNQWFQSMIQHYGIETPGKFSPFPPITAWLMIPISSFEPLTAQRIFTFVNLLFIVLGSFALRRLTQWPIHFCLLLLLSSGLSLINNIAFGQIYLIISVFILWSFILMEKKQFLIAAIIIGLFSVLKYFPLIIIIGLIANGWLTFRETKKSMMAIADVKIASYAIIVMALLIVIQLLYFGQQICLDFLNTSFLPHLDGELKDQNLYSFHFQSWDSLLRKIFVYDAAQNQEPLFNWPTGRIVIKIVIGFAFLILLTTLLYKFKADNTEQRRRVYMTLIALTAMVLLPASATYHYILAFPFLVLLISESILSEKISLLIWSVYALIGLIPYKLAFAMGLRWSSIFGFPRLWLTCFLFLIVAFSLLKLNSNKKTPEESIY